MARRDDRLERELGRERGETLGRAEDEALDARVEQAEEVEEVDRPPTAARAPEIDEVEDINPDPGWQEPPAGHRQGDKATDDDVRRKG